MQQYFWQMLTNSRIYMFLLVSIYSINAAALIDNGGFESQSLEQHWFVFGGDGRLSRSTTEKQAGNASVLIENRAKSFVGPGQNLQGKLREGVNYTLSAWVKPKQAPSQLTRFKLGIKQEDSNGNRYLEIDNVPLMAHRWTKLSGTFKLSPKGTLKNLTLYIFNEDSNVDFYVDEVKATPPVTYTPTPASPTDFIRAKGRDLVVGSNETPIRLIGTNFVAYGDDDEPVEIIFRSKKYDEIDFKRVADMGMNTIRLNLWYKVFEDDNKPGEYKQEGWEWLEKHIVWARKYGVTLILDMHAPPGGYQSWGYSGGFWGSNNKYRKRLNDLWQAIAQRYKDEPVIAAYDLINEPAPKNNQQWIDYAQALIDVIRTVDNNHLIIVEEAFTDDNDNFILNDDNVMYDFHIYETWTYSNQFMYKRGMGYGGRYPDADISVFPWTHKEGELVLNDSMVQGHSDWTYYEGKLHKVTNEDVFAAIPTFVSKNNGKVYFDDFVINEYHPDGQIVQQLLHVQVDRKPAQWYFLSGTDPFLSYAEDWKSTGNGRQAIENKGRVGDHSISISRASGTHSTQNAKMMFPVKVGYSYQINGWMKGENIKGNGAMLGLQLKKFTASGKRQPFTKAYLEKFLLEYGLQYYRDHNVPLNIGEFGVSVAAYQNDRGGERMVADFLDLFEKYRVNAQYFNYHGTDYGIYTNLLGFPVPEAGNNLLINTFSEKLGGTMRLPVDSGDDPDSRPGNQDVPDGSSIPDSALTPPVKPQAPPNIAPPDTENTRVPFSEACIATFTAVDTDSSHFQFPCIEVGGQIYSVSMNQRFSPLIFLTDVANIQLAPAIATDNTCLARYQFSDSSLYAPCVRDSGTNIIWEGYFYHILPTALFVIDLLRVTQR